MLAGARALYRHEVPIFAVNLGDLGFLTVITRDELYPALEGVLSGNYRSERRVQIEGELVRADEVLSTFRALNDVVLNKGAIARIQDFEVYADGEFISNYKSDGLIISTPTGSTAYSLAAGGPVVSPSVEAFIVTPICAHTLTNRPLVLRDSAHIEIVVKSQREAAYLTVDGQVGIATHSEDIIRVSQVRFFRRTHPASGKKLLRNPPPETQVGRAVRLPDRFNFNGAGTSGKRGCGTRRCPSALRVSVGELPDPPDMDLLFALAGLDDVIRGLHPHQRVHLYPERFFNPQRHVAGKVGSGSASWKVPAGKLPALLRPRSPTVPPAGRSPSG